MADSGLSWNIKLIDKFPYGGILNILTQKDFPENVRALRMLSEELLRLVFERNRLNSMEDLQKLLNQASQEDSQAPLGKVPN